MECIVAKRDSHSDGFGGGVPGSMITRLLNDGRVRFVIVGGINTVIGYGLFALLYSLVGDEIGYLGSLYISYGFATLVAFVLHRRFTYKVAGTGSAFVDFLRFQSVYVVLLLFNTVALPILVEIVGLHPLVAQAIVITITTVMSYAGHKWFSFHRHQSAPTDNSD